MASGAEREPGIEYKIDRLGLGRRVPSRHDPQVRRNANRPELFPRFRDPILVRDATQLVNRYRDTGEVARAKEYLFGRGLDFAQCRDFHAGPGDRLARPVKV